MHGNDSEAERQIARLLHTARCKLNLSVAFLSRIDEVRRTMQVVDSALPSIQAGYSGPRDSGFCLAVVEGRLPHVMLDARNHPEAVRLHPGDIPQIRAHISVPVVLSDGAVYGTFCAFGLTTDPEVSPRDVLLMEVLAEAAAMVIEPEVRLEQERAKIRDRLAPVLAAGGPAMVFQPIIELATGETVGVEALARFSAEPYRPPDAWFADAAEVGLRRHLELSAVRRALGHLPELPGDCYLSLNASPTTVTSADLRQMLGCTDPSRVVLELTEHVSVDDYTTLLTALDELRALGVRLAVDDAGAGFSSLRHILTLRPDIIKLDRTLVTGIDDDPARRALAGSLMTFAVEIGATVVAEGIENLREQTVLRRLGVRYGQGYHLGRPGPPPRAAAAPLPRPRALALHDG